MIYPIPHTNLLYPIKVREDKELLQKKKLGLYFNIKYSTKPEHQHDVTYLTQCPEVNFNET